MQVKLITHESNVFAFRTAFNTSVAYLSYERGDKTTTSLFGKTSPFDKLIKPSEKITIYLNQKKKIRRFNLDIARVVEVEIESFKDRLTLIRKS
jgi:hypothetical protein